ERERERGDYSRLHCYQPQRAPRGTGHRRHGHPLQGRLPRPAGARPAGPAGRPAHPGDPQAGRRAGRADLGRRRRPPPRRGGLHRRRGLRRGADPGALQRAAPRLRRRRGGRRRPGRRAARARRAQLQEDGADHPAAARGLQGHRPARHGHGRHQVRAPEGALPVHDGAPHRRARGAQEVPLLGAAARRPRPVYVPAPGPVAHPIPAPRRRRVHGRLADGRAAGDVHRRLVRAAEHALRRHGRGRGRRPGRAGGARARRDRGRGRRPGPVLGALQQRGRRVPAAAAAPPAAAAAGAPARGQRHAAAGRTPSVETQAERPPRRDRAQPPPAAENGNRGETGVTPAASIRPSPYHEQ
ncbi:hypothetical protein KUF71_002221, partial [Frankliniella fusca]